MIKTNTLSRAVTTLKLTALLGRKLVKKLLNGKPLSHDDALEAMEKLSNEFDGMKGLVMKFGQIASYLGTQLPPEARQSLERLQSASTSLPFSKACALIESEFESAMTDLFSSFDESAFAAASIGQVHRAIFDGKEVAVKVQ